LKAHPLELAGEHVLLLAQKAIFWPRENMLIVADIHFGKAASFRALGVPVPHGTTSQNLAALDQLIADYPVRQIVFLGDFLHARAAHASATLAAMTAWRARHPALAITLVRGNHDAHAGDPSARLAIQMVDEPHCVGPFAFCHHPDIAAPGYVMAGHVHPVFRLNSRGDTLRLPCFLIGAARAVLPSFGAFTGGFGIVPKAGEHIFVTTDDAVFAVASRRTT
jgi:DNA ligase-associated metallophosphoesterase